MKTAVRIVAEAAQGFEGRPDLARLLVRAAAEGMADQVKFQLVYADELAIPGYQYFDLFRRLEMPDAAWDEVASEAAQHRIGLAFDVYGSRSLALATSLGASAIKIHSTDFFNNALVDAALETGNEVMLSIGGLALDEVRAFFDRGHPRRADQMTLLYGFQAEPTAVGDNNLARLGTLRRVFPSLKLGFMDHCEGTSDHAGWLGVLALPYGISVLEKHITLGRALGLEDSVSALDATGFSQYVARVRAAENAIGDEAIENGELERRYRRRVLKVVVAARAVAAGQVLDMASVMLRRAQIADDAEPIHRLERVVGQVVGRALNPGDIVLEKDLVRGQR